MSPSPPIVISFRDAPVTLLAHARERHASVPHVVVGLTGPVGAGKSTLAREVAVASAGVVVRTDDFLPDYADVPYHERDDPAHADLAALAEALAALREGRPARVPVWSHHTHRREGEREIHPAPIVAVEGIHALHASIAHHLHIRVYVDATPSTRWSRWEAIERAGDRGMGLEAAQRFFHEVAEPTFARHGARARETAHFIVVNDAQGQTE